LGLRFKLFLITISGVGKTEHEGEKIKQNGRFKSFRRTVSIPDCKEVNELAKILER